MSLLKVDIGVLVGRHSNNRILKGAQIEPGAVLLT